MKRGFLRAVELEILTKHVLLQYYWQTGAVPSRAGPVEEAVTITAYLRLCSLAASQWRSSIHHLLLAPDLLAGGAAAQRVHTVLGHSPSHTRQTHPWPCPLSPGRIQRCAGGLMDLLVPTACPRLCDHTASTQLKQLENVRRNPVLDIA